jgi:hypothetical protein
MLLENQVCNLELAKKLKELEVKKPSLYAYYGNAGTWHDAIVDMAMYKDADAEFREHKLLPAYTVAELGEMLPWVINHNKLHYYFTSDKLVDGDGFGIEYQVINLTIEVVLRNEGKEKELFLCREEDKSEANARAKMLIYLIENKLLVGIGE